MTYDLLSSPDIDEIFPVDQEFIYEYSHRIDMGKTIAKKSTIGIFGIARNLGSRCIKNLNKILQFSTNFANHKLFIYENDSKDGTDTKIYDWSKNKNDVVYLSEVRGERYMPLSKSSVRTNNLARCRNACTDLAIKSGYNFDYALVIDMDFIDFSINGLFNGLSYLGSTVDAICGNSFFEKEFGDSRKMMTNYDSWAYRHTWWQDKQESMLWFQFWLPPVGSPPIMVNSAFGGSCWYKAKYFLSGEYSGGDCEHVNFNKDIKTKNPDFHLYLNPSQTMIV